MTTAMLLVLGGAVLGTGLCAWAAWRGLMWALDRLNNVD